MNKPATPAAQIGANVKAEMARAGLTQTDLASRLGLGQSGLSKRLRGSIAFDVNELAAVAAVLEVRLPVLLDGAEAAA